MKNYKILYYIGDFIGIETIVSKGTLIEENHGLYIESDNERISLNTASYCELIKLNGLGTMVKLENGRETIFLAAYRIFINIGTGFAITNYLGTINIKKNLDTIIKRNG